MHEIISLKAFYVVNMTAFWILKRRHLLWATVALRKTVKGKMLLPRATQLVVELRFEPRLSLGLAVFDLFNGQAGNTVDKGNF